MSCHNGVLQQTCLQMCHIASHLQIPQITKMTFADSAYFSPSKFSVSVGVNCHLAVQNIEVFIILYVRMMLQSKERKKTKKIKRNNVITKTQRSMFGTLPFHHHPQKSILILSLPLVQGNYCEKRWPCLMTHTYVCVHGIKSAHIRLICQTTLILLSALTHMRSQSHRNTTHMHARILTLACTRILDAIWSSLFS